MADKRIFWSKTGLTGGEATKLDSIDGADLQDGEIAHVFISDILYVYRLDEDSAAAEASPSIIAPDTNAGDKRWILQYAAHLQKVADATLSGVPVVLTAIGSDGTPYYFKAYPTKS